MAEQAFGRWTITDAIGSRLHKKDVVDVTVEDDQLRFRSADGTIDESVPVHTCRYDAYGKKNGFLGFGGEALWLKADSEQSALTLEAVLRERYVPAASRPAPPEPDPTGPTVTKTYRGRTPDEAAKAMTADGERMADLGYVLLSQTWVEPNRSMQTAIAVGGVIVALFGLLFLALFIIAVLIWVFALLLFVAAAASGGEGSLLVTYERHAAARATGAPGAEPAPATGGTTVRDRLLELTRLRDEGIVTEDEWIAKRGEILRDL